MANYFNVSFLKKVPANIDGRDFVIGDLHGCYDELFALLKHVKFDYKNDRVFSTGDLIDRGPKSLETIALLKENWFFSVLGNHEDLLINTIQSIESNKVEGLSVDTIYEAKQYKPHLENILKMPLVYEINHLIHGKVYIVHAEILPEHLTEFSEEEMSLKSYQFFLNSLNEYDFSHAIQDFFVKNENQVLNHYLKQKLIWSRKNISLFYKKNKIDIESGNFFQLGKSHIKTNLKIFCGHNIVPFPMKIGQQYYVDTGAALGYSAKEENLNFFNHFGHQFFNLSLVDITTGGCYGYATTGENKSKIFKLEKSLYT